jgi:hypothetical protein
MAVLKCLARCEHRLFADHARALHFLDMAGRIFDDPMTAEELNGRLALVGDPDGVMEDPLPLERLRLFRRVARFDLDTNVVRHCF